MLKLLHRSVPHHNLSVHKMNNDQSFSPIPAVGAYSYPRTDFDDFEESDEIFPVIELKSIESIDLENSYKSLPICVKGNWSEC